MGFSRQAPSWSGSYRPTGLEREGTIKHMQKRPTNLHGKADTDARSRAERVEAERQRALVEWEQEEDPGARELIALAYQLEREASLQEIDAGERELLSLTLRS